MDTPQMRNAIWASIGFIAAFSAAAEGKESRDVILNAIEGLYGTQARTDSLITERMEMEQYFESRLGCYDSVEDAINAAAAEPNEGAMPVEPAPVEPAPVEPAPVEPAPVEPAPVEPAPVESAPKDDTKDDAEGDHDDMFDALSMSGLMKALKNSFASAKTRYVPIMSKVQLFDRILEIEKDVAKYSQIINKSQALEDFLIESQNQIDRLNEFLDSN